MNRVLERLQGGLVASCQPVDDGPMDRPETVAAMARAAVAGGAQGLRIEGVENLRAVRSAVDVPIIGIVKSDAPDTPVRITVAAEDARALAEAGADIVAYDATDRPRRDSSNHVLNAIRQAGALAMADCSTLEDGNRALSSGAAILGTTLSGYTDDTARDDSAPDLDLVAAFHRLGCFVMAEGRFDTPDLAMAAIEAGANAVTVGSSLTRLEVVTERFARAVEQGVQNGAMTGYAVDLGGTKTAAAHIVDSRIARQVQAPTDRSASADTQIEMMGRLLDQLGYQIGDPLGVAVTGRVDSQGLWYAVNRGTLEEINTVPLASKLEDRFGTTRLINDAAAAALAEHKLGAGRGHKNFAYITVSTGVGGGLILNGKLHRSADGFAGHIGFASTPQATAICGSGRFGTVESRAGGRAIADAAEAAGYPGLSAHEVFSRAESGSVWAEEIIQKSAHTIAGLSADLVAILGVRRIVLGGSIGLADRFLERIHSCAAELPNDFRADLVPSSLGNSGPLLGALLDS